MIGLASRFEPTKRVGAPAAAAMREHRDQRQEQLSGAATKAKSCPRYQKIAVHMQPTRKPRFDEAFCVTGPLRRLLVKAVVDFLTYPAGACYPVTHARLRGLPKHGALGQSYRLRRTGRSTGRLVPLRLLHVLLDLAEQPEPG